MDDHANRSVATVERLWAETPSLMGALLAVPEIVRCAHTRPGQYVVLRPDGDNPVPLAVASAPGAERFELLVGAAARARLALEEGAEIRIDPPKGAGYPIELAEGRDVLLFAVGSGLSPIRSVIEHVLLERDRFGAVTLYAGARSIEEHAYRSLEASWRSSRIGVVRAVSRPWVQEVFRARQDRVENAVAFVCGMRAMVEEVTEALVGAGLPRERVWQNG